MSVNQRSVQSKPLGEASWAETQISTCKGNELKFWVGMVDRKEENGKGLREPNGRILSCFR